MNSIFKEGDWVVFKPRQEGNLLQDYSLDGVSPGDFGVVKYIDPDGDAVVDFVRRDGTSCEGFYAFPEDLEKAE